MKMSTVWPPYSEQPRVADQITSGADARKGLSGRAPLGDTRYNNTRPYLVSESYPKAGRKFKDEE